MRKPFKPKQKPTSTDHQLWRISLVIGVGEDSTYNHSGLACLLDAISTHTSIIVVSSDEDKLTIMSEASWDAITKPISADDYSTVTAGDDDLYAPFIQGTPQQAKRIRGEAVKANKRWTATDLATIKRMRKQNIGINAIADALGRTPSSVRNQIQLNKGN